MKTKFRIALLAITTWACLATGCDPFQQKLNTGSTPNYGGGSSTAGVAGTQTANLSWNATTGASGYKIQMSTDQVNYVIVTTVGASVTTAVVKNLVAGQPYWFQVVSYNAGGTSTPSPAVKVTP